MVFKFVKNSFFVMRFFSRFFLDVILSLCALRQCNFALCFTAYKIKCNYRYLIAAIYFVQKINRLQYIQFPPTQNEENEENISDADLCPFTTSTVLPTLAMKKKRE